MQLEDGTWAWSRAMEMASKIKLLREANNLDILHGGLTLAKDEEMQMTIMNIVQNTTQSVWWGTLQATCAAAKLMRGHNGTAEKYGNSKTSWFDRS